MNQQGELLMTLKSIESKCVIGLSQNIHDNSLSVKKRLQELTSQLDLRLNNSHEAQTKIVYNKATKIDLVIEDILKNIRRDD